MDIQGLGRNSRDSSTGSAKGLTSLTIALLVAVSAPTTWAQHKQRSAGQIANSRLAADKPPIRIQIAAKYAELPMMFESNQGQTDSKVKFLGRGSGYAVFLTQSQAVLAVGGPATQTESNRSNQPGSLSVVRLSFANANEGTQVVGQNEVPGKTSYFVSGDPAKWHTKIPNYASVAYRDVYPGVEAVFHGNPRHLELDFDVAPGADPSAILLDFSEGNRLSIDKEGDVLLRLGKTEQSGEIELERPSVFQEKDGERREVAGKFVLHGPHRVGFELGPYDHALPIIIDPTISYSTYLGATVGSTYGGSVAVDSTGSAYVTGYTIDPAMFPTPTGPSNVSGTGAVFVTKFSPDGSALVYTALLPLFAPGTYTTLSSIAIDASGSAYLLGTVYGNFATQGAYHNPLNGLTVVKLSPDGSQMVYAAQLGPSTNANGGIAVDPLNNAYVVSTTNSSSFPTTSGAWQSTWGCQSGCTEATITKLSADGSQLVYSTFLGGSASNYGTAIAVDAQGDAYVAGVTTSTDFPITTGAIQSYCLSDNTQTPPPKPPNCGDTDAFVTKLNATGSGLIYSTYLGNGLEAPSLGVPAIALDAANDVYVAGTTISNVFASALLSTSGPTNFGPPEQCNSVTSAWCASLTTGGTASTAFLGKISATGTQLMYLGFLGGYNASPASGTTNGSTWGVSVGVDPAGRGFLTGATSSSFYPVTPDALQASCLCGEDAIFSIIDPTLSGATSLVYSTYLGGSPPSGSTQSDQGTGLAVDNLGNAYLTGNTADNGFPTTGYQKTCPNVSVNNPYCSSAFVTKFSALPSNPAPFAQFSPAQLSFGNVGENSPHTQTVTLTNTGAGPLTLELAYLNITGTSPGYSIAQEVCEGATLQVPQTLANGQSCTFTIEFDPPTTGPLAANLHFLDNAAGGQSNVSSVSAGTFYGQLIPLSGTGVAASSFTISASKTSLTMTAGGTPAQSTVTVTPSNGFTDTVNLSATSSPTGVTASFSPSSITGGSGTSTLTLSAAAGSYTVSVTGTDASGSPTASTTINLTVNSGTGGGGSNCACATTGPYVIPNRNQRTISSISGTTVTTTSSHGLAVGQVVQISGTANSSDDGVYVVATVPSATTFTATPSGNSTPLSGSSTGGTVQPQNPPPASPHGKYTVVEAQTNNNLTLQIFLVPNTTTPILNQTFAAGTTWGFSPDDDRLEVDSLQGSEETVSIYNLTGSAVPITSAYITIQATASSSRIIFSPSGQYLGYMALVGSSTLDLQIYNVLTGKKVYDNNGLPFQTVPGQGQDQFGAVGDWGFSPDSPETSFVYAYLDSQSGAQLILVHLEQSPLEDTNGNATSIPLPTWSSSDFWQFSPCGDAFAIVNQGSTVDIQLFNTADGLEVSDTGGLPAGSYAVSATATEQIATSGGVQTALATNSASNADLGCSALNMPAASNVTVQPPATGSVPTGTQRAPVTLTFSSINSPGGQLSLTESSSGQAPPNGFQIGSSSTYYDLTYSPSTLTFTSPVLICIDYTGITFTGQPALYHIVAGSPVPITTMVDTVNHMICGSTPSLSPFAIFSATAPVSTTTGLSSSLNPAVAGQSVTLTAQVSPSLVGTPTGTVTFSDGGNKLGGVTLNATGLVSLTTSALTGGSHSVTAAYSGDSNFAASASSVLTENVQDYSLTVSPASLTVSQGQAGTATFTVTFLGGYNQTLTPTCSGLPAHSSCSFSPSTIPAPTAGGTASSTVTFTTDVATAQLVLPPDPPVSSRTLRLAFIGVLSGLALAVMMLLSRLEPCTRIGIRNNLRHAALCGLILCGITWIAVGCSGSSPPSSSVPTQNLTPAGTSAVTVTFSGGAGANAIKHTVTLNITVNQ